MISVENFLAEVSSRAIHIASMISDMKQYTLSFEVDFQALQELSGNLEKMNDKYSRKLRGKSEKFESSPAREDKKANRVSRGVDRAKQMIKPEKINNK